MSRFKKGLIEVSTEHACEALTGYLQALSLLDDDYEVVAFVKSRKGLIATTKEVNYDAVD